jgi:proteasome ATPase
MNMPFQLPPGFTLIHEPSFVDEEDRRKHEVEVLRQRCAQLESGPIAFAVVTALTERHAMIATGAMVVELERPPRLELKRGHVVRIRAPHGAAAPVIAGIATDYVPVGKVFSVKSILDEGVLEIDVGGPGRTQTVMSPYPAKVGDRVLLDQTGQAVVKNLGQGDKTRVVEHATGVSWDDIGGQEEAKRELVEAIEWPVTHRDVYAEYKLTPSRGVLLWGPPGCGKTMLGKASATALARVHHQAETSTGFIYVKGPDILRGIVGESEREIRQLFAQARAHFDEHGYPAIVFVDEADAVLTKRGMSLHQGMERTIVPQFLSEMDGLFASSAFVLLATNRPDTLDPAVVREGRIDRKVEVRRPDRKAAREIACKRLQGRPCHRDQEDTIVDAVVGELYDDKHAIYVIRCRDGGDKRFPLAKVVSGAMVAGVVERATQHAIRRLHTGGSKGISTQDVREAVEAVLEEQRSIDHGAEVQEFCKPFAASVLKIDRPGDRDNEPLIKLH